MTVHIVWELWANCIAINICICYSWHGNLAWNHITARRLKVKVNAEILPVSHLASFPGLPCLQFLIAWFSIFAYCKRSKAGGRKNLGMRPRFCAPYSIENTTYTKSRYCHIKKVQPCSKTEPHTLVLPYCLQLKSWGLKTTLHMHIGTGLQFVVQVWVRTY